MTRLNTTHGMSCTKEYGSWRSIKSRCFDINNKDFPKYGEKGMDKYMAENFLDFLSEIGRMPDDGKRYTCGRIDNNLGYVRGNIRWETYEQQNRNRGRQYKNKSGVAGVWQEDNNGAPRWVAGWYDLNGKIIRKCFNIKKLGDSVAFQSAVAARREAIDELNRQGAGYSLDHV